MSILYRNVRNARFVLKTKTSFVGIADKTARNSVIDGFNFSFSNEEDCSLFITQSNFRYIFISDKTKVVDFGQDDLFFAGNDAKKIKNLLRKIVFIRMMFIFFYWVTTSFVDSFFVTLIEFFMIRISVRLSDRSKVTQHKMNFIKNCPQWGLNSQPPDHQSGGLPTVLSRNLLEISEVNFLLFHAPLHMLALVYF